MYRLLIVDDEYEIRKGLESADWEQLGIRLAGSCEHGLEAFQFMMAEPVDILLTDVRMPFMDGFELIKQAAKPFPYLKTVILTGYNDFNYAQQGIRLGIADYLLKPAKKADIYETFGGIVRELDRNRQQQLRSETLERKAKLGADALRQRFMEKLLFRALQPEELEEGAAESEMLLNGRGFAVLLLRLDRKLEQSDYYSAKEWRLILFALHNLLTEFWDERTGGYHWIRPETGECFLLQVFGGSGSDHGADAGMASEAGLIAWADAGMASEAGLIADAMAARLEASLAAVTEAVKRLRGLHLSTVSTVIGPIVGAAADISLSALTAAQALGGRPGREQSLREPLANPAAGTAAGADSRPVPEERPRDGANQTIVDEAKRYIDLNFEKSVTLQDLAAHIHVNPNYLSTLFRKSTGQNYIHYLTERRMQRAMQLLRSTDFKVYEICEMVGYSNTAYFTELFRKQCGCTPHEYRSARSREGAGLT
ncbi:helix-turn-helix domain-containing protein [Paenibacillus lycopersici]|uniref:Helix-turn-helix domain-containing protein n=1 Tax=Paenibacillus lycopersici TaxID=2704462 RepID=A0A6C0FRD1_9BACL|nr:helix-turn-helix domain-containing protein [Paenibacillus lycopersici]QHT59427.1 helix-turn-helix domain-containing protein [Paenibacillus lycopersici]